MNFFSKVKDTISKQETAAPFLALVVGSDYVEVAVWSLISDKVQILGQAQAKFEDEEQLSQAAACAIDEAEEKAQIKTRDVIFGVPDFWTSAGENQNPYLQKIKSLASNLDLQPSAFVSTTRALIHLLKREEGTPPTAIMVEIGKREIIVSIVRVGKIEGTKIIARTDDLPESVEKAITLFPQVEVLPSRMLLLGKDEDWENLTSNLVSYPWTEKLPFLHFPKIDSLPQDILVKATVLAGSTDVSRKLGIEPQIIEETDESNKSNLSEECKLASFAYLTNQSNNLDSDDDFGFIKGKDITRQTLETDVIPETVREETIDEVAVPQFQNPVFKTKEMEDQKTNHPSLFPKIKTPKLAIPNIFSHLPLSKMDFPLILKIGLLVFILGIAVGGVGLFWYLPKAQAKIYVDAKTIDKELEVVVDPALGSINETANILPGKINSSQQTGSVKGATTGKGTVGDKARGEVTIFNKTFNSKTLSAGTTVTAPNGLNFTLDNSVSIASQSATTNSDEVTVITPGKAKTSTTASTIGAQYNLPSGIDFTISGQNSSFKAKSEQAFTGGSSRQVNVVAETDLKSLTDQLSSQLIDKVKADVVAQGSSDQTALDKAVLLETVRKNFSKAIGDEANDLSLNMEIKAQATLFSQAQLKDLLIKYLSSNLPADYQLKLDDTQISADVLKLEKDGKMTLLTRARASLIPKLSLDDIRKQLVGKKPQDAQNYLQNLPNTVGFEVHLWPQLPGFLQTMPRRSENIQIEVAAR